MTTVAAFAAPGALAAGYVAFDGSSVTLSENAGEDLNPRGGRLRLGFRVSEAFDIEAHAGIARERDSEPFDEIQTSWAGMYLKGYLPVGVRSALFVLGGVAGAEITQTIGLRDFSDERSGFSFGAGLETGLSERLDLSADWMRYTDGDEDGAFARIDAVSIGLKLYF